MAFWDHDRRINRADATEPLRQNRWYLSIFNLEGCTYALKECQKPSYTIKVTEHTLLNKVFRYPGIMSWKPIQAKIVSTAAETPDLFSSYQMYRDILFNNKSFAFSKKDLVPSVPIEITQVDELGVAIERWILTNGFISDVNFGNLTYDNESFVEISFTIQYDHAKLEVLDLGMDGYKTDGQKLIAGKDGTWGVRPGYPKAKYLGRDTEKVSYENDLSVKR